MWRQKRKGLAHKRKQECVFTSLSEACFWRKRKTFSFAYAIIRGWLSAYMPTTELWCWKENFGADGTDKAYLFALLYKNKYLRLLTVCLHTISKRRYLYRLCHKSDGCLSGFIQVTLVELVIMASAKWDRTGIYWRPFPVSSSFFFS